MVYDLATNLPVFEAPAGWDIRGISPDGELAVITEDDGADCQTQLISTIDDSLARES